MHMHEVNSLEFVKGELRKVIMKVSCNCENECDDFEIRDVSSLLKKNDTNIGLQTTQLSDKTLEIIIDCRELEGFYKLIVTYEINDQIKISEIGLKVRKL